LWYMVSSSISVRTSKTKLNSSLDKRMIKRVMQYF